LDLNDTNYKGRGQTPLFDETVKTLASVLAKCQEYASNGIAVRTITLIVTDGADYGSNRSRASDVKSLVQEMLRQENHIIAAMGVSDGNTDFKDVFQGMGIPDAWILTPGNTPTEIRRAFQVFSQSAVRASQSAGSFSKASMGGFSVTF
jgi:hypothetical protein